MLISSTSTIEQMELTEAMRVRQEIAQAPTSPNELFAEAAKEARKASSSPRTATGAK